MYSLDNSLSLHSLSNAIPAIKLSSKKKNEIIQNRLFIEKSLTDKASIYGINTGFGPLVSESIPKEELLQHQTNLLQQLSGATGPKLSYSVSRLIFLIRIHALSQARSGVSLELINYMISLYNLGFAPVFYQFGSVGASGDLVPLASLARMLVGKDDFWINEHELAKASQLNSYSDLPVYQLKEKEGLALVNGTSYSLGITVETYLKTVSILHDEVFPLIALQYFIFNDSIQHLSELVYSVKAHESALTTAAKLRDWLSPLKPEESHGTPQPPYSSRSVVLWMGTAIERLSQAEQLLNTELNAVDDNPLFFHDEELILHAANFQGTYIALAADQLAQALTHISILLERIVNRITHAKLNNGLPAFLADAPVGLNSGLQGLQLLLTSLTADMRTRAVNHSLSSIPTNADNQDIVSMSANAAHNARELGERFDWVIRVFKVMVLRALHLRNSDLVLPPKLKSYVDTEFKQISDVNFSHPDLDYKDVLKTIM
ncbi:aromatic amino acid lyase [bacterium]|nr:MAG: aromatic amino acid lyase [bacterium]